VLLIGLIVVTFLLVAQIMGVQLAHVRVLETMARMRVVLEADTQPGPRWVGSRCRACGFFETCRPGSRRTASTPR
jgi:CRISPR/Cas system-associated exonuclease Cas4 (RecB family)